MRRTRSLRSIGTSFAIIVFTQGSGFGRCVVFEILLEGHQGVGRTAVGDLSGLGQRHEAVARAAFAVAGRAEARHVAQFQQPAHHFVQRAVIAHVELCGILFSMRRAGVTADAGARAAADLRNADFQHLLARALRFAGRDNHARIRDGDADHGDDLAEYFVRNGIREVLGVDVVGRADAGYADGVGTDAEAGFEVLGVHEQSREVVPVGIQTEQYADTHVVDAAFHRAVHRFGVIGVVALRAGGVECFVSGFVVGFLEENVGADACIAQFAVVLDRRSRDIYVHAADRPVLVMYGVDRLDRFENVLDRIVARVLSGFECQTLVTHILQRDNLAGNLFLRQLFASNMAVFRVIRTVNTAVYAVIRQIQRRKHNNTVAVERQLDLLGQLIHLLDLFGNIAGQQHGGFAMRQTGTVYAGSGLLRTGLFQNAVDQLDVMLVLLGVFQRFKDFLMVDKLLCME